jgi:hypothetical protein
MVSDQQIRWRMKLSREFLLEASMEWFSKSTTRMKLWKHHTRQTTERSSRFLSTMLSVSLGVKILISESGLLISKNSLWKPNMKVL